MAFKVLEVQPLFNNVITTANKYVYDGTTDAGLVLVNKLEGQLNPMQIVVAKGPMCSGIEKGSIVKINFSRYVRAKHVPGGIDDNIQSDNLSMVYEVPCIEIDGKQYLQIQYSDIEYVVTKYEADDGGLLQ